MECIPSLHFGQAAVEHLSLSSGNVQLLPNHQADGIENQYPLPPLPSGRHTPQHFPIPSLKLGSNDGSNLEVDVRRRYQFKPRRSKPINVERPYLHHPKYLEYRSRPRQDIGKDGNPIWPDHIEAAFQDALVHIRPMGRRKCSQRGKPFGRNMLIAEWIFRATGHKRERKQVSSHIQVLDRFLCGIPEWDLLIKPGDADEAAPTDGHKFYHNSIEHMVNEQKAKSRAHHQNDTSWDEELDDADDSYISPSSTLIPDISYPVEQLNFEMWVSSPDDQDRALHYYTGLKSNKLAHMPLEELAGWRLSYPHLTTLFDRGRRLKSCDLILLNTNFKLMQEFPPPGSKLGIGLELRFPDPLFWQGEGDADFKKWGCTTYMYRDGVPIGEPTREECQVSEQEHWKVRPFFQSKWWASTFTSLTEARKVAEDSKDPEAIEQASEQSRSFFQGLSIMQEISAVRYLKAGNLTSRTRRDTRRRMAILLWEFSDPVDSAGTTVWQNLIAPPDRLMTNSPPPTGTEMDLPPLSMESIVSPAHGSFDSNNPFMSHHSMEYDYHGGIDDQFCQDGFMGLKPEQTHEFGHLNSSFDLSNAHQFSGVDPSLHDTFQLASSLPATDGDLFNTIQTRGSTSSDMNGRLYDESHSMPNHNEHDVPLSRFDSTTHQLLQEQLNGKGDHQHIPPSSSPNIKTELSPQIPFDTPVHHWGLHTEDDERRRRLEFRARQELSLHRIKEAQMQHDHEEAMRNALLAASAMSDLGAGANLPQTPRSHVPHSPSVQSQLHNDPHWVSPMPFRPPLQSYHSFPSMRHDEHMHRLSFGTEHGHDFSLSQPLPHFDGHGFLDHQLSAVSAPGDFLHASDGAIDDHPRGLTRAHSEPDPGAAAAAAAIDCFSSDPHIPATDTGSDHHMQEDSQQSELAPGEMNLGGSFVEVSMVDVQG